MDKIIIRQLRLETMIGLYPWERQVRQQLLVDMEIGTDISAAAASDDLHHTINYAEVCEQVAAVADAGRFKLLETFAERIARLVLTEFAAPWIKVSVYKLDTLTQVEKVGVVIERGVNVP